MFGSKTDLDEIEIEIELSLKEHKGSLLSFIFKFRKDEVAEKATNYI